MKIAGHPIHLMLVHFPSALFPMDCVCSLLNFYTGNTSFYSAALYAMTGGVYLGWLASAFGAVDLFSGKMKDEKVVNTGFIHAGFNIAMLLVYTVLYSNALSNTSADPKFSGPAVILKVGLVLLMFAGNFFGGKLVLKYRMGAEDEIKS